MKTLKFFTYWDATTYEKEYTEIGTGLSTKLGAQALTSIDYNKYEPRRCEFTFFDDGWFLANVLRGETIYSGIPESSTDPSIKTSWSSKKVRLFDGENAIYTGLIKLEDIDYDYKTSIVKFTAKSPVALFKNSFVGSAVYAESDMADPKSVVSLLEASVLKTVRRMDIAITNDTNRYSLNITHSLPYDVVALTMNEGIVPLETITIQPPGDAESQFVNDWGYPIGTEVDARLDSRGFKLDVDGSVRFYNAITQPRQRVSVNGEDSVVIWDMKYYVYKIDGLSVINTYSFIEEYGNSETINLIPDFFQKTAVCTDSFVTVFPLLSNELYDGGLFSYTYDYELLSIIGNGSLPITSVLLDDSRLTDLYDNGSLYASFTRESIFNMCRVLLLFKVYADVNGKIIFSNIIDTGSPVVIDDASETTYSGVIHSNIDLSSELSPLKKYTSDVNSDPISVGVTKSFAEVYSNPVIKTKTMNPSVKVDGVAIVNGLEWHVNKVTPDKRNEIFIIEGWEYNGS